MYILQYDTIQTKSITFLYCTWLKSFKLRLYISAQNDKIIKTILLSASQVDLVLVKVGPGRVHYDQGPRELDTTEERRLGEKVLRADGCL